MMEVSELLAKKRLVLLEAEEGPCQVVIEPMCATPDGEFIKLGGFYADQVRGWYRIDDVAKSVLCVLKEFEEKPQEIDTEERNRFWKVIAGLWAAGLAMLYGLGRWIYLKDRRRDD
jgi:hypothetical protein